MRNNYLVEHTVGSVIGGAFRIYFRHFATLFLIYVLPVLPVVMMENEAVVSSNRVFIISSVLIALIVGFFAWGAMTVAVSDICLGNAPSFKRSYGKIFDKLVLMLLVTNILQILAIAVGTVLLIIPGLVLAIWLMMSPAVVVLERRSGIAALRRSKQLGDGSHWRNAGLLLLLTIILAVVGAVMGGVFGFAFPHFVEHWIFRAVFTIIQQGVAVPLALISGILIYYDRRVRKEGYDAKTLAEDLAR